MKTLTKDQRELLKKHGLRLVVLFGSQVDGTANENSDYDIAILTERSKSIARSFDDYTEILFLLEKVLGIPAEKIDLTNLATATPLLLHEIFENSRLISGDELDYEEQRARAFRKCIDAQPLFALRRVMIKKRQEELRKKIYD